eukprot:s348_g17.t1
MFAEAAEEAEADAADPLSGGLRGRTTRKRAAEEPLFGQGEKASKAAGAPKAAAVLTLAQQARKEQEAGLQQLFLRNCRNVTLIGRKAQGAHFEGGLLAPGNSFWRVRNTKPQVRGYCLLKMDGCEDMRISSLHLHDSPMYQVVVARSHEVELNGLRITLSNQALGDNGAHNTDGVNILNSSRVTLRRSVIESGDDNVVVKEGSSDIFAESLQLRRGKGVSIGSLGEREAEGQEVTNVVFRDVSSDHCVHGVRIKTWKGARGLVQNATFERFRVADVMVGILIDQTYCPPSQRPEGCATEDATAAIRIQQVRFKDFSGTFHQMDRKVLCSACDDVTYESIALRPAGPAIPQRAGTVYRFSR